MCSGHSNAKSPQNGRMPLWRQDLAVSFYSGTNGKEGRAWTATYRAAGRNPARHPVPPPAPGNSSPSVPGRRFRPKRAWAAGWGWKSAALLPARPELPVGPEQTTAVVPVRPMPVSAPQAVRCPPSRCRRAASRPAVRPSRRTADATAAGPPIRSRWATGREQPARRAG